MRLSNQYRILYRRIATLTDDRILELLSRYGINVSDDPEEKRQAINNMRTIEKYFQTHVDPRLSDLLTEWVVKLNKSRYVPWNLQKYGEEAKFYKSIYAPGSDQKARFERIQKFREAVAEHNEEFGKSINSRNILDFNLEDMDDIQEYYKADPKVDQLQEKLPNGARLIYNDGIFQIVEALTVEALCYYGQKSRWCTRKPGAAEAYLESGPVYVIFKNGKRYAQYQFDGDDIGAEPELVSPKQKVIYPDDEIRKLLIQSKIITPFLDYLADYDYDPEEGFDEEIIRLWKKWIGTRRIPELEGYFKTNPTLNHLYMFY